MTTRWLVVSGLSLWVGSTLLLSLVPWFRVPPLVERLRPYSPSGMHRRQRVGVMSADSLREVIGPLVSSAGDRVSRMLGINDELSARLARSGSELDVTAFRLRQAGWAAAATVTTALVTVALGVAVPVALMMTLGAPALAFLVLEQQVSNAAQRWQDHLLLELPVLIEQLGMLLSSGYSLGAAISRLGQRGRGLGAIEMARIASRVSQGVSEVEALREWAAHTDIVAVDRLVSVLALNWEAGDLGSLIGAEARSVRREVQRAELEVIDKRAQQVWIPVTVATLLPGVIFMAVPFVDAMSRLTGG